MPEHCGHRATPARPATASTTPRKSKLANNQQAPEKDSTPAVPTGSAVREPRFPLKGYLLINAVVWVLLALIYFATKGGWFSAVEASVDRPATAGVLFIIAACFAIASIYDYFFDRYSERAMRKRIREKP